MRKTKDMSLCAEANETICEMARRKSTETLNKLAQTASGHMKSNYQRSDN